MSKPILKVTITNTGGRSASIPAVFDTGSFYTLIRQDRLPAGTSLLRYRVPEILRAAAKGSRLRVIGETGLIITIGRKKIRDTALVTPDLAREMILGAGTMQKWDISVHNRNGKTRIAVGRDMSDPEITEVD